MRPTDAPLNLADLLDISLLQELAEANLAATGMPLGVIDTRRGHLLLGAGWQAACMDFHRAHPHTRKRCEESDRLLAQRSETGIHGHKCPNGLWDFALPILVDGKPLATVFLGQFLFEDEPLDLDQVRSKALQEGFDASTYAQAMDSVPRFRREQVTAILRYNQALARVFGDYAERTLALKQEVKDHAETLASLVDAQDRWQSALDLMEACVWDCDLTTHRVQFTHRWRDFLGLESDNLDVVTGVWRQRLHPDHRTRVLALLNAHLKGQTPSYEAEYQLQGADGSWRWVLARGKVRRRDLEGRPLRFVGMHLDITERKAKEAEREKLSRQLEHALRMDNLGFLTGVITHDLSNLLTIIYGNLQIAHLDPPEALQKPIWDALQATRRAMDLSRQMLSYARGGTGNREEVDLAVVIAEFSDLLRSGLPTRAELILELPAAPTRIKATPCQVQQMLLNLVLNSAQALGDQGGRIEIRVAQTPGVVLLEVNDNASSQGTSERQLTPFAPSGHHEGVGLGLASLEATVHHLGGSLTFTPRPDGGTRVEIHLPEASGEAMPAPSTPAPPPPSDRGILLVADDEPLMRKVICHLAERFGFRPLAAQDGLHLLDLYQLHRDEIACILVDLAMPRLDGYGVLEALASLEVQAGIILFTGFHPEVAARCLARWPSVHLLPKPFSLPELEAALDKACPRSCGGTPFAPTPREL